MLGSWRLRRGSLVAMLSALALGACGFDRLGISSKPPDPAEVAALAKSSYRFENPTPPMPALKPLPSNNVGVPAADAPKDFTVSRAVPTVSPAPKGKVILALVHSDKPYKYLGIETGDNYVWRDERPFFKIFWKTYMVPASPTGGPKKLKRGSERYSEGDHAQPRLVYEAKKVGLMAYGACLDDPNCGSGHCGYGDVY